MRCVFFCTLCMALYCQATTVKIRITDPAGADGLQKVLVIVQALNGKGEVTRELTDRIGAIPVLDLQPGLYGAVATFPYGYWATQVREFSVADTPVVLELHMDGSVINEVQVPEALVRVTVLDRDGHPISNALVLGRDPEARFNHWTRTDPHGEAGVVIGANGADIVAIHEGQVTVQRVNIPFDHYSCTDTQCLSKSIERMKTSIPKITLRLQ